MLSRLICPLSRILILLLYFAELDNNGYAFTYESGRYRFFKGIVENNGISFSEGVTSCLPFSSFHFILLFLNRKSASLKSRCVTLVRDLKAKTSFSFNVPIIFNAVILDASLPIRDFNLPGFSTLMTVWENTQSHANKKNETKDKILFSIPMLVLLPISPPNSAVNIMLVDTEKART